MANLGRLSIVVYEGRFDRVHYALAMASAAAAIGQPATLFFTMDACRALGAAGGDGAPGWHGLAVRGGDGDAAKVDAGYAARGVGAFEDLLSACVELGVTFMVCEMGLRARDLDDLALRDDVPIQEGGLVTVLKDAESDGTVVLI